MNLSHRVGSKYKTARLKASSYDGHRSFSAAAASVVMSPRCARAVIFFAAISSIYFLLYGCAFSGHMVPGSSSVFSLIFPSFDSSESLKEIEEPKLGDVLRRAPGSVIDLFFESFEIGEGTSKLLNHLVIIALDAKAYSRCQELHQHCFSLKTEGVDFSREAYFMTPSYLNMMWRRIDFLRHVLEMGYNFVFTDADVMWFRNPFPRFHKYADFQIACDQYLGSSSDLENIPNGGFIFVRSNNRTIHFYKYWYNSRIKYPGHHDQDVLNFIKKEPYISRIGLRFRFLNTAYFGGLCEPSKDLNLVCTMHANCCFGMDSKLHDLGIMLQDWRDFMSLPFHLKQTSGFSWKVPQNCSLDSLKQYDSMDEDESEPTGQSQE